MGRGCSNNSGVSAVERFVRLGDNMRTKQLLQAVQTVGSDVQTLMNYLALHEEHSM